MSSSFMYSRILHACILSWSYYVCMYTQKCLKQQEMHKITFFYQQAAKIIDTLCNINQVQVSKAHGFLWSTTSITKKMKNCMWCVETMLAIVNFGALVTNTLLLHLLIFQFVLLLFQYYISGLSKSIKCIFKR